MSRRHTGSCNYTLDRSRLYSIAWVSGARRQASTWATVPNGTGQDERCARSTPLLDRVRDSHVGVKRPRDVDGVVEIALLW